MADDDEAAEAPPEEDAGLDDEEGDEEGAPARKPGRKKLFIIIGAAVFVLAAAGAGVFFSGLLDPLLGLEETAEGEEGVVEGQVFYKLEDMTLNLRTDGKKPRYLKFGITIVLMDELDIPKVEALQPRIVDSVVNYLSELKPDELAGSANFYRMRENVLLRVQVAVAPVRVTNVLFSSVLVQ
ncbi:MAG: flagellar basal body-associated FliL family protein [Rhodospirillales bacterium]